MATQLVLTVRKEALFKELTDLANKVKKGEFSIVDAKVYLRRMSTLESSYRALQIEILTFNSDKEKKESVIVSDLDAFVNLIDFINSNCLAIIEDSTSIKVPTTTNHSFPI